MIYFFRTFVAVVCTVYQGGGRRVSIYYDLTLGNKTKPFKHVKLDGSVPTSEIENLRLLFATCQKRRRLGRVNFRKDFWECYYGMEKIAYSSLKKQPTSRDATIGFSTK